MKSALLVDLDDSLYSYAPAEAAARKRLCVAVAADLGVEPATAETWLLAARDAVKRRIDGRGSSHSRLLYLHEMIQTRRRCDALLHVRRWDRIFWGAFIEAAEMRPGALALLDRWRARGGLVALVTDLTLEVQLWKVEAMGLASRIDALVVSEEVFADKPARAPVELALERLGVSAEACVMIGDDEKKDGGAARELGIPFYKVDTGDGCGWSLVAIAHDLGLGS